MTNNIVRRKPSLRSRHKKVFAVHESAEHVSQILLYGMHLEPKSHAKSKKRREQEKFKSRYNESSKVYRFIETVAKKTSIERIKEGEI